MSQFSKCKSLSLEILAGRGEQLSRFIQEKGRTIQGGAIGVGGRKKSAC